MKRLSNDTLSLDDLLQDANRHLQQLNYIVKELDNRGATDSFIVIAKSCQPLYVVLVDQRLAQVTQERDDAREKLKHKTRELVYERGKCHP